MFKRMLTLPKPGTETFFLWGPRQTGKSTLLRSVYPGIQRIDLLKSEEFRRYLDRPETLREEVLAAEGVTFVVIDEVQKLPSLLDEVHWLLENRGVHFALCGSSARKVRRGHANLLGGRAVRYELFGLVSAEIGPELDLTRLLNHGYLPRHYLSEQPARLLSSYVSDYLKEEIAAEGLVRNLPAFSSFLSVAALSDAELVNFSSIARDCGVSSHTVQGYFEILEDTLLGRWLQVYRKRPKRRLIAAPKFYFQDVGVVNFLAKRRGLEPGGMLFGKAFENWVLHELTAHSMYRGKLADFSYWRLTNGFEADFIVNDMEVAVEAKATAKVTSDHLKGLRELKADHPEIKKRFVVSLEPKERKTEDGILVLPYRAFASRLWQGGIF